MSDKELLIREMMQSFKAGNYRLTIELVNKIINMGVEDYRVYMLGGQTYFILQELDDAIFYLKRADKLSGSNNGEALFALGNCYFAKQQFDDAISVFSEAEKAGVSKATKAKVQYMLGLLHKQKGEYTKALDNYEKARRIDGENEDYEKILLDEAEIHFNRRDFVKAEEIVRKLILLRPAEYKCYKLLFQILVAQKKFNEANEVLVEAFKVCGNIDDIRIELGFDRVWMFCICSSLYKGTTKRDYLEKALKELDIVCKEKLKEEDKYEVFLTRAQIYLELEEYKKAVECLDGIEKEENPDFYEYIEKGYYINIQCYSMLGEYKKADEYIVKLKNSNNKIYQFFAIYKEAYLLKKSGDEEFVEKYNEIIAFFRNEAAQSLGEIGYLATMYRAKCYIDIGKYEKAKETSELLPDDMKEDVINYINESMKKVKYMINKIIIDQDELKNAADGISALSGRLATMRNDIENHLQGLKEGFNTPAGRKYIKACESNLLDPMDKMKSVIDHVSSNLRNANSEYKSVFDEYEEINNSINNFRKGEYKCQQN